jgi:hypothetical protein
LAEADTVLLGNNNWLNVAHASVAAPRGVISHPHNYSNSRLEFSRHDPGLMQQFRFFSQVAASVSKLKFAKIEAEQLIFWFFSKFFWIVKQFFNIGIILFISD